MTLPVPNRTRRIRFILISATAVCVVVIGGLYGYYRWKYPYGYSHCCLKGVGMALRMYAEDNHGRFPSGGDTPEASLSLLYSNYLDAEWLRGKTVSAAEEAKATMDRDGKLGPDTCGWHYVDGLTENNDPRIAIVWDKVGLDHHGGRVSGSIHEVALVDGSMRQVPGHEWSAFLEEQQRLLANRPPRANQSKPE